MNKKIKDIKKIKVKRPYFWEGCSPAERITLGIKVVFNDETEEDYIFGDVYFGEGMINEQIKWLEKTELFIDTIIYLLKGKLRDERD